MRNWICILILAAFVTTTIMPAASHAMPQSKAKTAQTQDAAGHDCHKHNTVKTASEKTALNDKVSSGTCCNKGVCKCVNGTCHGGLAAISGNRGNSLLIITAREGRFEFAHSLADSALPDRLKRPPRV
jgi:hypothetical protein